MLVYLCFLFFLFRKLFFYPRLIVLFCFFSFTLTFSLHTCDLEYAVACHSDFPVRIEGFIPLATEMVVS